MNKPRFLLTGGTGFLGQQILPYLREWATVDVISRSGNSEIKGDLTLWNCGITSSELQSRKYDAFIHLAALYDLKASRDSVLLNNVVGTSHALGLASQLKIPVFVNTSSIAAAINSTAAVVSPYDLNFRIKFPDPYAESKALAEKLIANWDPPNGHEISRLNIRLGILVGDTVEGKIQRIDGVYHTPEALRKIAPFLNRWGKFILFPGNEKISMPLLPVNQAAQAVSSLIRWMLTNSAKGYRSFHLTPKEGLRVRELYSSTLAHLVSTGALEEVVPFLLVNKIPKQMVKILCRQILRFPEEQVRYALNIPQYDSSETRQILGQDWCSEFSEFESIFWSGYEKFISNS